MTPDMPISAAQSLRPASVVRSCASISARYSTRERGSAAFFLAGGEMACHRLVPAAQRNDLGARGGDDDARQPLGAEHVGQERRVGGQGFRRLGEADGPLDVGGARRGPLPAAEPLAEFDRPRVVGPLPAPGIGAQHAQLAELGRLRGVGRRPQRHDLQAQVPRTLRPVEQHIGSPRPHRRAEPGEHERVAVHRERGLQVEAAERRAPRRESTGVITRTSSSIARGSPRRHRAKLTAARSQIEGAPASPRASRCAPSSAPCEARGSVGVIAPILAIPEGGGERPRDT